MFAAGPLRPREPSSCPLVGQILTHACYYYTFLMVASGVSGVNLRRTTWTTVILKLELDKKFILADGEKMKRNKCGGLYSGESNCT